jgi:hypothetical protein
MPLLRGLTTRSNLFHATNGSSTLADGECRFDHPTLLLLGRTDTNVGPAIAERLAHDIPGVVGIEWLTNSPHLPMLDEPEHYAQRHRTLPLESISDEHHNQHHADGRARAMRSPISPSRVRCTQRWRRRRSCTDPCDVTPCTLIFVPHGGHNVTTRMGGES